MKLYQRFVELLDDVEMEYELHTEKGEKIVELKLLAAPCDIRYLYVGFRKDDMGFQVGGITDVPEDKYEEMLELINRINMNVKFGKFYIDDNDMVTLECGVPNIEVFEEEEADIVGVINLMNDTLQHSFPLFMAVRWG